MTETAGSTITVAPGDPRDPEATALLQASHALMQSLFPAEANHYLSIDALCVPAISFYVARRGDRTLGCAALALKEDAEGRYGELKSMFVAPEARGAGAGRALLDRVEAKARERSLPLLRLETGSKLHAAHRLYAAQGFAERGPFGDYPDSPHSLFMEKRLA